MVSPAVSTKTESDVPATRARTPRREMVGAAGVVGTKALSTELGLGVGDPGAQLGAETT